MSQLSWTTLLNVHRWRKIRDNAVRKSNRYHKNVCRRMEKSKHKFQNPMRKVVFDAGKRIRFPLDNFARDSATATATATDACFTLIHLLTLCLNPQTLIKCVWASLSTRAVRILRYCRVFPLKGWQWKLVETLHVQKHCVACTELNICGGWCCT